MNERSDVDRIAQEAARLFDRGKASSLRKAIEAAAASMRSGERLPSVGQVRRHLQGRAMQALGDEGYRHAVQEYLSVPEALMTALTEMMDGVLPLLVGRTAVGLVDGPARVHVRVYTEMPIDELAQRLVDLGYEEPSFETVDSRFGRLNRLVVVDEGVELVLTRCPAGLRDSRDRDLFTARPIPTADLSDVRRLIERLGA